MATMEDIERLVEVNRSIVDAGPPASEDLIRRAEVFLNVPFPKDYFDYLKRWGSLAIGPLEFYGVTSENFESSSIPNGIWFTHIKRKQLDLPHELIVIANNEGDELFCLNTADRNSSRIIVWDTVSRRVTCVRANSIFDFIFEMSSDAI